MKPISQSKSEQDNELLREVAWNSYMLHGPRMAMEILESDISNLYDDFFHTTDEAKVNSGRDFIERIGLIREGFKALTSIAFSDSEIEKSQDYHWCRRIDAMQRYCHDRKDKGTFYKQFAAIAHEASQLRVNMKPRSASEEANPLVKASHIKELCLHFATLAALIYALPSAGADAETARVDETKQYPAATARMEPTAPTGEYGVHWSETEKFPVDTEEKSASFVAFDPTEAKEKSEGESIFLEKIAMEEMVNEVAEKGIRHVRRMTSQLNAQDYDNPHNLKKLGIGIDRHIVRIAVVDDHRVQMVMDTSEKFEGGEGVALETWDDDLFFRQDGHGFLMMKFEKDFSNELGMYASTKMPAALPYILYDEDSAGHYRNFRMAMLFPSGPSGHFSGTVTIPLDVKYEAEFNVYLAEYKKAKNKYPAFLEKVKKERYSFESGGIRYTNDYDHTCRGGKTGLRTSPEILKRFQGYTTILPPEVVEKFGPDRIVQSGHCDSPTIGAYRSDSNLVCICDEGASKETFFHEFFHAMDAHSRENYDNDESWERRFDPEKKFYGKINDRGQVVKGFVRAYGAGNAREDRATFAEALFMKNRHADLLMRARKDKVLRDKIETITGCIIDTQHLRYVSTMTPEEYTARTGYNGYRFFLEWSKDKVNHEYWNKILAGKPPLEIPAGSKM